MILTEETHSAVNTCTMETDSAAVEDPVFGQSGPANEVETTRAKTPAGWQSVNTSASVSQLGNLVGYNVGPNSLQKVMAGDQVTASVQYYYQSVSGNSNPNIVANILNILAGAIGGPASAGTVAEGQASAITTELGNSTAFLSAVNPANPPANTPQAYLTILFFDERFNLVSAEDGGVMQQQVASSWSTTTPPLAFANVKAPKNGYVFIYVSNLSDQTVYFDNLAIGITAGKIIEEDHYYSFGLKIAGISSKKLGDSGEGTLKNNFLYNGKEYFDEGGLDWLDYGLRNYDPQVGRFVEMDPLMDHYSYLSPYQYAGNDPIANIDKNGMGIFDVVDDAVEGTGDAVEGAGDVVQSTKAVSQVADIAMTVRSTVTVVSTAEQVLNVTTIVLNVAATATHFINTSITSQAVGDDLSRESLSRNPDFDGLTLGNLRNMIRTNGENLEEWMVNISAGLLLEDMYGAFSGLTKNYSSSTIFFPSGGLLPIARIIVPDFIPGVQNAENPNRVAEEGGIVEVKAIGEAITSSTSNWQIKAEGLKVASAEVVTNGLDDPRALNPTAGELKIASITFVVPSDKWVDPSLIADMTALGVNVFVSYPYLNLKTGKIVFSTPEKLNFISPTQPYKVQGNINGITPEPKKAADRWRVNQKNDIDGPQ
jgi:RHS repeat-associated protein